jgi:hypothetical protein
MRATLALMLLLVLASSADAKDFQTMVLVGSRGDSRVVHGESAIFDAFFDFGSGPVVRAEAGGPYVQVYLLAPGGLPGIPGRFYPRTRAACFSWNPARRGPCFQPPPQLLALLQASDELEPIKSAPTTIAALRRSDGRPFFSGAGRRAWANLGVALEMAFGRADAATPLKRKPSRCIEFSARWRGPQERRESARTRSRGRNWCCPRCCPQGKEMRICRQVRFLPGASNRVQIQTIL